MNNKIIKLDDFRPQKNKVNIQTEDTLRSQCRRRKQQEVKNKNSKGDKENGWT